MNTATDSRTMIAATVDRLAQVKAEIARLTAEESSLKDVLIASGEKAIDGTLHRAAVSYSEGRTMIDWKTIAERFNPSHQLITAHTSTGAPFFTVRVSARKGA
jgi:hypothetical protein